MIRLDTNFIKTKPLDDIYTGAVRLSRHGFDFRFVFFGLGFKFTIYYLKEYNKGEKWELNQK